MGKVLLSSKRVFNRVCTRNRGLAAILDGIEGDEPCDRRKARVWPLADQRRDSQRKRATVQYCCRSASPKPSGRRLFAGDNCAEASRTACRRRKIPPLSSIPT